MKKFKLASNQSRNRHYSVEFMRNQIWFGDDQYATGKEIFLFLSSKEMRRLARKLLKHAD